jgi:hypothetical protein
MLYRLEQYISNSLTRVFAPTKGQRVKYTANTGLAAISTANSNLDGTGTLTTLITGAGNGTLIKTITIKGTQNLTRGMVRLFISDGTFNKLLSEIDIPEKTQDSTDETFNITLLTNFMLKSGYIIKVSTQNAESSVVIADGLDTSFP